MLTRGTLDYLWTQIKQTNNMIERIMSFMSMAHGGASLRLNTMHPWI